MNAENQWTVYRTRFLVRARKLNAPLFFIDAFGREQAGQAGDYLVESSDGLRRIAPCNIFEDIYVPLNSIPSRPSGRSANGSAPARHPSSSAIPSRQAVERRTANAPQSVFWSG